MILDQPLPGENSLHAGQLGIAIGLDRPGPHRRRRLRGVRRHPLRRVGGPQPKAGHEAGQRQNDKNRNRPQTIEIHRAIMARDGPHFEPNRFLFRCPRNGPWPANTTTAPMIERKNRPGERKRHHGAGKRPGRSTRPRPTRLMPTKDVIQKPRCPALGTNHGRDETDEKTDDDGPNDMQHDVPFLLILMSTPLTYPHLG